jgi:hypothetical protein
MLPPLDVFRIDPDGAPVWLDAFADFQAAEAYIRKAMESKPARYFVFSQKTERKTFFNPPGVAGEAPPDETAAD